MSYIDFGNARYSFQDVARLSDDSLKHLDQYAFEVLKLARNWFKGQKEFTLKTSGSTGKPKSITFTRGQIHLSVRQTVNTFKLEKGEKLFNPLSVQYVAGFMMLMRGLVADMPVFCVEPSREPVPADLLPQSMDFGAFVPIQFTAILDKGKQHRKFLERFHTIILGGGPVNHRLELEANTLSCRVYHTYGMTETLTHVAIRQLAPESRKTYRALEGNRFEQDTNECLIIHTAMWEKPVHTNDKVELHDEKSFAWIGRSDNVINSGGYKIQVEKVEEAVSDVFSRFESPVPEFFVTGLPDDELGEKAVLILKEQHGLNPNELVTEIKRKLHRYEVPKHVYILKEFVYTHTGKIDREAVKLLLGKN